MSRYLDDRWLWIGFGAFFFIAAHGLRYAFEDLASLTLVESCPDQIETNDPSPEDSIELDTLRTLASSTNLNIASSATAIILRRAFKDTKLVDSWLMDELKSRDPEIRRRAEMVRELTKDYSDIVGHWPGELWCPHISPGRDPIDDSFNTPESLPELIAVTDVAASQSSSSVVDEWSQYVSERRPPLDDAEFARRRDRREAIVFHEGEGGIVEEDIIRRR